MLEQDYKRDEDLSFWAPQYIVYCCKSAHRMRQPCYGSEMARQVLPSKGKFTNPRAWIGKNIGSFLSLFSFNFLFVQQYKPNLPTPDVLNI